MLQPPRATLKQYPLPVIICVRRFGDMSGLSMLLGFLRKACSQMDTGGTPSPSLPMLVLLEACGLGMQAHSGNP